MVQNLITHGYNRNDLEAELASMGYELGAIERNQKYRVLEKRKYLIDASFPKITDSSFVGGQIPMGILQITYTIDLESIPYTGW